MWSRAAQARVASRHLRGRIALLADPTRVQMLWAPRLAELDVASLAGVAGSRSTVASQHLSKLRFGGLVEWHPMASGPCVGYSGATSRYCSPRPCSQAGHHISGEPTHD